MADLERAKSAAVMIRTELGGASAFGAGFVIAVRPPLVYVVTANHLMRTRGGGAAAATSIKVAFQDLPGEWFEAKLLELVDADLDLAVVRVDLPRGLDVASLKGSASSASQLTRGADVYPLGFAGEEPWNMPPAADKVAKLGSARLIFASQFVRPGSSGGPLLDACGRIVGMVTAVQERAAAEAVPMETIVDAAKRWSLPAISLDYSSSACGGAASTSSNSRGGWKTADFPPPNAGTLVFTIMPDGNPACASYDGGGCLWGQTFEQIEFAKLRPLVCGEGHRAIWGVTGYENPKHWCNLAKAVK